jgi:carbon starvation protein
VGSGTSSKQLDKDTDARYVGYGGALGEGTLAVTSIIACTAGFAIFAGLDGWHAHYGSWAAASAGATTAFVNGVGVLAEGIGIPSRVATIFAAVVVISFAATTLDTSVRLQRYIIGELGVEYRVKLVQNRWVATLIAVVACALLALGLDRGAGGMRIWPLFGTTNQLLAGLSLLIITLFLFRQRRAVWVTIIPMTFLLVMTTWAMILNLRRFAGESQTLLLVVGGAIFVLEIWLLFEAVAAIRRVRGLRHSEDAGLAAAVEESGAP